jgi:hypothetical protein
LLINAVPRPWRINSTMIAYASYKPLSPTGC